MDAPSDHAHEEPWIEVFLHPQDPQWAPSLADCLAAARSLGLVRASLVLGGARAERWDDPGERELLVEALGVAADDLEQVLACAGLRHVALVLEPAELGLLPALAACAAWDWQPLHGSLTWGLTTLPPLAGEGERRFHAALVLAGPGETRDAAALRSGLRQDAALTELLQRVSAAWGQPAVLSLAV